MVPSSRQQELVFRPVLRNAASLVLLFGMGVLLAGCNEEKLVELFGTIAIALLLILLVQVVVWAGLFSIMVINLVYLGRGKPNLGWGMTSLCAGAFALFPNIMHVWAAVKLTTVAPLAFSLGLCWVGYKNVKGARERARWERLGDSDADDE